MHACMHLQNVCIKRREPAPYDDGMGSCELSGGSTTSRAFAGVGGTAPMFTLTSTSADTDFAGRRTAAARRIAAAAGPRPDKKATITQALRTAGITRPAGNTNH